MTSQGDLQLETLDMESYLSRLASSAPTPGGGAVAGLTGAQAAAARRPARRKRNLSRGERFAEVRDLVDDINETCETARYRLMILANDDARVFAGVMSAYALKKSSEAEKSDRAIAIQLALAAAAEVPMKVMKETSFLLPLADSLADIGNSNLISDIGVAVHLIDATLYSARFLKDMALVKGFDDSIAQILENLELLKPRVLDKVNKGLQEK